MLGKTWRVEGLLQRRTALTRTWRVRLVIIDAQDCQLVSFKVKAGASHGALRLEDAQWRIDLRSCYVLELPPSGGYHVFHLHSRDGADSFFRVESADECREWIRSIRMMRDNVARIDQMRASSRRELGALGDSSVAGLGKSFASLSLSEMQTTAAMTNGAVNERMVTSPACEHASLESFDVLSTLGKGAFARVFLVRERETREIFAMKVIPKERLRKPKQVEHTLAERALLSTLDHPFIVRLRMSFHSSSKLYLILSYVSGGELFYHQQRQGRFTVERTRLYLAETFLALQYLHSHRVVYRDLKLENMLLDKDGHVQLADFGLVKQFVDATEDTATFCGTPEYLAPEVVLGQRYSYPVDWWSLGVVAFEMAHGRAPFEAERHPELYEKIVRAEYKLASDLPPLLAELIRGLLVVSPFERLAEKQIQSHPFFTSAGISWDDVLARRIEPAFRPFLASEIDASNFDPEFTRAAPTTVAKLSPRAAAAPRRESGGASGKHDAAGPDFSAFDYFPMSSWSEFAGRRTIDPTEAARLLEILSQNT